MTDFYSQSFDQRQAARTAEDKARDRIKDEIAKRTEKPRTEDERLRDSLASELADLKQRSRFAASSERDALLRKREMYESKLTEVQGRIDETARVERLARDPAVANARTHASAFAHTPPPGSDPNRVALAVALAQSNEWDDPGALVKNYWGEVRAIEEIAWAAATADEADAQHAAIAAEHQATQAGLRRAETAKRLHDATTNAGGNENE